MQTFLASTFLSPVAGEVPAARATPATSKAATQRVRDKRKSFVLGIIGLLETLARVPVSPVGRQIAISLVCSSAPSRAPGPAAAGGTVRITGLAGPDCGRTAHTQNMCLTRPRRDLVSTGS